MARGSEAAASLVQVYFGGSDAGTDVASFFSKSAVGSAGAAYPRIGAATAPLMRKPTPAVPLQARQVPKSARQASPSSCSLLSGSWAPVPQAPRRAVSSDGAAVKSVNERELQESISIMASHLQDGNAPMPNLLSLARRPNAQSSPDGGDMDASASSFGGSQGYPDSAYGQTVISHATTPSWRSRTFPPNFLSKRSDPAAQLPQGEASTARRRLPSLPEEARIRTPCSEVARLADIAPEVNEANALLVESYLNVKRRPVSRAGASSAPGPSSGSASCVSASSCSAADRLSTGSSIRQPLVKTPLAATRQPNLPPSGPKPKKARPPRKHGGAEILRLGSCAETLASTTGSTEYLIDKVFA